MARGEQLIRQWNLVRILQSYRYGIGTNELADRLECSKRQVQRDLHILQEVGFPVSFEERDYGKRFWKLAPHFLESDQMLFSMTEIISLFLSRQLLAPLQGTQLGDGLVTVLGKIKAMLPPKALEHFSALDSSIMVKNISSQDYSRHDKKIRILNQAILQGRVVRLCYKSISKKQPYDTFYHPYGLVFFESNLYCIGYMTEYEEIRTLKINRIISAELTGEKFQRPSTFSLQAYTKGSFGIFSPGELQAITVKFTGWAAAMVREQKWHHSQQITEDTREYLLARYELSDTTEFIRWILGFGTHALVLQPASLARKIRDELSHTLAQYDRQPSQPS